ncbi:MAG: cation:proton antiporter [Vicinamibacterales bacterium]
MHDLPLLLNIAVALAYALAGGIVATRLGLPSIVGYLIAGVAIGPTTPGFVGSQETIAELAELGVVFLMFGVGLHFSFKDLWQVRTIALPGASIHMLLATGLGYLLAHSWGWSPTASLIRDSRFRWRAPSCSCARSWTTARSTPSMGAWPSAGSSSRTSRQW